jgi:hypothetical protein
MKIKHEIKLERYKKYKEKKQMKDLELKTTMPKYMANVSLYRLKFKTTDLMTNY